MKSQKWYCVITTEVIFVIRKCRKFSWRVSQSIQLTESAQLRKSKKKSQPANMDAGDWYLTVALLLFRLGKFNQTFYHMSHHTLYVTHLLMCAQRLSKPTKQHSKSISMRGACSTQGIKNQKIINHDTQGEELFGHLHDSLWYQGGFLDGIPQQHTCYN